MQREIPEWVNISLAKHSRRAILDVGGSLDPIDTDLLNQLHVISPNYTERIAIVG